MDEQLTDPHVNLAFGLRAVPGGYAVLLGAGASVASGMKSAWAVQRDLILQLAAVEGATPDDTESAPFDWYEKRFGKPVGYDSLLRSLAST